MKYSLGLDIGTTSIGWAVINEDKKRIEDVGVRIFDVPENPKNGQSLALPRRVQRSARRRIKRRRQRLDYLKQFFIKNGLLEEKTITELLTAKKDKINPYESRVKSIKQKISNDELFVALYHIAKRRGYKSNRKKVEENSSESGQVLKNISENSSLLKQYKSIAEALLEDDKFKSHKRNKLDSYSNSFIREDFEKEIIAILKTQEWSDEKIRELLYDVPNGLFYQRPFMTKELIEKMRGKCPFEKGQPRAQKASYTFELFRLAQDLNNLSYNDGQKLSKEQIANCIKKAKETQKVTYKAIKEVIGFKNDSEFRFDYIRGKDKGVYEENEKNEFCNLKYYHAIKKACTDNDWQEIENNLELFDNIGYILTACKEDNDVRHELDNLKLSVDTKENLMALNFNGFCHLSLVALRKITNHLLEGKTYDKAIEIEYPGEFKEKLFGNGRSLPQLSEEQLNQITNPVVKRAISQTRKVVNAIIGKYDLPYQIKIECANALAKSFDERRKIKQKQDENAENNNKIVEVLRELGINAPNGQQIIKYRLYTEQLCKCAYCGKSFGPEIFFDEKMSEIDHIIPFSRCGNDSRMNKVLVCSQCNQEKTNNTPYEKWGKDIERWNKISELVNGLNIPAKKRERILSEKTPKEDWNSHALNDTRFIMKFMQKYIKANLKFSGDSEGKQRVVLPTGSITHYLRKMYHLGDKDRDLNNCHHAVDACVIATVSQAQIKKFAEWNKYKELGAKYSSALYYDENGEPHQITKKEYEEMQAELLPWDRFDQEARIRTGFSYSSDEVEKLSDFRDKFRDFKNYDREFVEKIHPLFVSRMPKRSARGQAHKETIRSPKVTSDDMRLSRKRLSDCTIDDVKNSVLQTSDKVLYEQLVELWKQKGKDAFKEPIYKNNKTVDKNGKLISPVTTIKVYSKEPNSSGILINGGTQFVNNGSTVCLNIYKRNGKYFCAPVYVHALKSNKYPILPCPKGKNKTEKEEYESLKVDGKIFATKENGFEYVMSVFPNDYIRLIYEDHVAEGYYVKYGITGGTLSLVTHNSTTKDNLSMTHCSVGSAAKIEKMEISVLGDNYREI